MERSKKISLMLMVAVMATLAVATMEEDEKECADQMANLAACIPFVSGSAKKPTAECCDDAKKARSEKPKCLCVLIKESADPAMGLPVNTTLALQMPAACNIDAKVSDCPSILNLPAGSPDAKIFKEADESPGSRSSTSQASPTSVSPATPSSSTGKALSGSMPTASGALRAKPGGIQHLVMMLVGLVSLSWVFV